MKRKKSTEKKMSIRENNSNNFTACIFTFYQSVLL